LASLILVGL